MILEVEICQVEQWQQAMQCLFCLTPVIGDRTLWSVVSCSLVQCLSNDLSWIRSVLRTLIKTRWGFFKSYIVSWLFLWCPITRSPFLASSPQYRLCVTSVLPFHFSPLHYTSIISVACKRRTAEYPRAVLHRLITKAFFLFFHLLCVLIFSVIQNQLLNRLIVRPGFSHTVPLALL